MHASSVERLFYRILRVRNSTIVLKSLQLGIVENGDPHSRVRCMPKSLIQIFEDGLGAHDRGLTCDDNPHPPGTPEHQAWEEGCLSALGIAGGTETDSNDGS